MVCVQCGALVGLVIVTATGSLRRAGENDDHNRRVSLIERQRDPERERSGHCRAAADATHPGLFFDASCPQAAKQLASPGLLSQDAAVEMRGIGDQQVSRGSRRRALLSLADAPYTSRAIVWVSAATAR